jgi:acetyl esterase
MGRKSELAVAAFLLVVFTAPLRLLGRALTDVEFARPDGVRLTLDGEILDGQGPFPTIVFVHGGGFSGGDKKSYPKAVFELLTQAGFNWFSVNYRLSPRYVFPAHTDDVESAVAFLKAHAREFKIDDRRMVLMGASAGGHLVSFVGAKHKPPNRVAAVVSFYGEHDLVSRTRPQTDCAMGGAVRHSDEPQTCLSDGLKLFLGIQEVNTSTRKLLSEASAITYVKKDMPPYLLIHGTEDLHVPYEQSLLMREAVNEVGAQCDLITVQGGGHGGWDSDPTLKGYQTELLEWLREILKFDGKT